MSLSIRPYLIRITSPRFGETPISLFRLGCIVEFQKSRARYDVTPRRTQKLEAVLPPELISYKPLIGKWVLDVGCGQGKFVSQLRKKGVPVIGVDKEPPLPSKWLSFLRRAGLATFLGLEAKNSSFIGANACFLPFPDNTFDVIYSTWSLHSRVYFYSEKPEILIKSIQEMWRVLKPGGTLRLVPVDREDILALLPQAGLNSRFIPSQFDHQYGLSHKGRRYWIELEKLSKK